MKRLLSLVLLAVALVVPAIHAADTGLTSTTSFYRFQCDPKFDANGNATSAVTEAFWQVVVTDSTGAVIASTVTKNAQWDAVAKAASTIVIGTGSGSITLTYGQVLQAVMAIAEQEKTGAQ